MPKYILCQFKRVKDFPLKFQGKSLIEYHYEELLLSLLLIVLWVGLLLLKKLIIFKQKMKKIFLTFFGLLAFACSDNDINTEEQQLEQNNQSFARGVETVDFGDYSVNIVDDGYDVNFKGKLHSKVLSTFQQTYDVRDHGDGTYTISNPNNSNQYYRVENIRPTETGSQFDIIDSNGITFPGVQYNPGYTVQWCPPCVGVLVAGAVTVLTAYFEENDCQAAISACVDAGGFPSTTIESGWFGDSCSVNCAQPN